eukprot:CAMPEP_0171654746 /NCGR_PEP_ID=MMETSP0990-20121206/40422_1 /TAXON_ID=483369 /ORGANISM="non described non described, Strain CCMP2098" /LENGTH=48 /DNA_ID= /DNA_START= /DNA_END= /DNA_ORIENTATION=
MSPPSSTSEDNEVAGRRQDKSTSRWDSGNRVFARRASIEAFIFGVSLM